MASPERIDSPANQTIKDLARLQRASVRRERGCFLLEGRRAIASFLEAGWPPQALYLGDGQVAPSGWPPAVRLGARALARVSQALTPSGYLAVFGIPTSPPVDPHAGGLLCWGLRDPGNLGTLLRSAVALGWSQVVLVDTCDPWSPKVLQASAGTLAWLTPLQLADAAALQLLAEGAPGLALVPRGGQDPERFAADVPRWLVLGGEAAGVPEHVVAVCADRLTLPMRSGCESLNAAVAGSIACWCLRHP